MLEPESPMLRKGKHVTYWLRCLKTFLPHHYTSMDANRMSLAFFIVSALDLLGALDKNLNSEERKNYIDWIYHCQHPDGGFRGFPGTDFGLLSSPENSVWDPANVAATYFALATLLILHDDLQRVKRKECLTWLAQTQRPDGSFGQTIGPGGSIEGGFDTRFGYTALCIRWILGDLKIFNQVTKLDLASEKLIQRISQLQTYDGGYSDLPFHEAHGGYTYCAVSAMSIAGKAKDSIRDLDLLVHWLVSRQTTFSYNHQDDNESESDEDQEHLDPLPENFAGFSGRCNKVADTCYVWWIGATLKTLGHVDLINTEAVTNFLLNGTQHAIGGFGKLAGDPPDIYHSYLGLAALSVVGHPDVKPIDPAVCISLDALQTLSNLQ